MISIIMNLTNMSFGQQKTTAKRMRTGGRLLSQPKSIPSIIDANQKRLEGY